MDTIICVKHGMYLLGVFSGIVGWAFFINIFYQQNRLRWKREALKNMNSAQEWRDIALDFEKISDRWVEVILQWRTIVDNQSKTIDILTNLEEPEEPIPDLEYPQ